MGSRIMMAQDTIPADGKVDDFQPRDEFRAEVRVEPGHAIRKSRGDGQNYGVHSMGIRFLLHGPAATVQFLMWTGITPFLEDSPYGPRWNVSPLGLMAADLGYHADAPQFEGHEDWARGDCDVRSAGRCYYDGSGLAAEPLLEIAIKRGHGGVFRELQRYYDEHSWAVAS